MNNSKTTTTIVTGLWNIKRNELSEGWGRGFEEHYLKHFKNFLKIPYNLIIFGDSELKKFVDENKTHDNIQFVERSLSWFKNQFYNEIQTIRQNSDWYNQKSWLTESTQAKLEYYNPIVMQKMFLLNDATILDKFNSDNIFWLDAGITNTVHEGYFTHDRVFDGINNYIDDFTFICFPYDAEGEIHGFKYDKICEYTNKKVNKVARGGFFGGNKKTISKANEIYYSLMFDTLNEGLMGTEESLFTIMLYKYPELFSYYEINSNGLINKFFEDLKDKNLVKKKEMDVIHVNKNNIGLYVITFNSPKQFETLIESFYSYDEDFINRPKKYLLNNSTDESTDKRYKELCLEYEFEELRFKENLGICGGRQYIAEHAEKNNLDYYFFFEDDMFFYPKKGEVCRNGFNRYVENLYDKTLKIIQNNNYDFLKLSFSEFFGDNSTQWSWYNVPQNFRESHWPNKNKLPKTGFDPDAPKTKYNSIKSFEGIPYADGEIYYSNWPQIVSKEGNKKMFLTEKWAHPYEQTWMSYIFQETIKDNIKPAILLMSPTEHDRFEHYNRNLRKES